MTDKNDEPGIAVTCPNCDEVAIRNGACQKCGAELSTLNTRGNER